jgi:peroxiredoxin
MKRARMMNIARVLGLLVMLQGIALYVFRELNTRKQNERTRFTVSALSKPRAFPVLEVERSDGTVAPLENHGPRVIHFWATAAPTSRTEMPAFLEAAAELEEQGIEVVAVSADAEWKTVDRFFDNHVPKYVVRARDRNMLAAAGVGSLPDAYLIDRSGQAIARFAGARDWHAAPEVIAPLLHKN